MSAYSKIVREDIIDPVIKKINETLNEFAKVVSTQVNVERLKDVLELREKEEEPDER
jgi:23S rRNA maturation mini-RNase III